MPPFVLTLLEAAFGPIISWLFGKSSDKVKQEEMKKEMDHAIAEKNQEVKDAAAPDRSDADVINSLRKRQFDTEG